MIVQNENLIQIGQTEKAERKTVSQEVMASVNSKRILGQNSNFYSENSNYDEKMLRQYIIGTGNYMV